MEGSKCSKEMILPAPQWLRDNTPYDPSADNTRKKVALAKAWVVNLALIFLKVCVWGGGVGCGVSGGG